MALIKEPEQMLNITEDANIILMEKDLSVKKQMDTILFKLNNKIQPTHSQTDSSKEELHTQILTLQESYYVQLINLKQMLHDCQKKLERQRQRYEAKCAELKEVVSKLKGMKNTCRELKKQSINSLGKIEYSQEELKQLWEENQQALEITIRHLLEENQRLNQTNASLRETNSKLEIQVSIYKKAAEKKTVENETTLRQQSKKIDQLAAEAKEYYQENCQLHSEIKQLKFSINTMSEERMSLCRLMDEIKEQLQEQVDMEVKYQQLKKKHQFMIQEQYYAQKLLSEGLFDMRKQLQKKNQHQIFH